MRARLAVVASLLLAGCAGFPPADVAPATADSGPVDSQATVLEVVDGDTLDVRLPDGRTETVRLLGVDTPETYAETAPGEFEGVPDTPAGRECLRAAGENATAFTERFLEEGAVRVRTDPGADRRGSYGRLLAYVTVDGESLNRALVAGGHARLYDTSFARRDAYATAEDRAQTAGRGVWTCRL